MGRKKTRRMEGVAILVPSLYILLNYINGWDVNYYFFALWGLLVFLTFWGEPADQTIAKWGYNLYPNVRLNVKVIVIFLLFLCYQKEYGVGMFGSFVVFLVQNKDLIELTGATKALLQKYQEVLEFSDVRLILNTMCKHNFEEKSGQVDVLITVLKMLDQQNCDHKKENKALVERLKKLELEKSRQRQSHNKVFDFSALETKSSETQKKVHQLEKQLAQAQKDLQKIKRESEEKDSIIEEQGVTLAMDCANEKELKRKLESEVQRNFEPRLQVLRDKNKGLSNELENTNRRLSRKIENLQTNAKSYRAQIEKFEKDLKTKTEECGRIQIRADKAKARNDAKIEKMKDHNTKLKNEFSNEKEKSQKLANEISELKNCLIKSAKKTGDTKSIDSNSAHECPICACVLFEDHSPVSLKCGHVFGRDCIVEWLKKKKNCPNCNQQTEESHFRNIYL